ncbi:MAG: LPS export ABC transporter permease LptG [Gammaproteobacteria bacterium RBG_16_57_12]|nr:MAG: LPS export ABC transporter permease LptG [Gammaproteobacteria bacterium RBG_16_57_12]
MKILYRYIADTVIINTLIVLLVLLGLFAFFTFFDQMKDVGMGSYTTDKVMIYVAAQLPGLLYQLMPIAAMLGSIIGLGMLANNNELTVMRATGISVAKITWSLMRVGLFLVAIAMTMGEAVAPLAEQYAQRLRADALSENIAFQGDGGMWARDNVRFINIRKIGKDGQLGNVYIYEMGDDGRLRELIHARQAMYQNGKWLLKDVQKTQIAPEQLSGSYSGELIWESSLSPELLGIVQIDPESMTLWGLKQYIDYLRSNGLRSEHYRLVFWNKLMIPVITMVMIFLAIPFVFGSTRSVAMGQRILVGVLLGIGFHMMNRTLGAVGLAYDLSPLLSATGPALAFLLLAIILMRRVY